MNQVLEKEQIDELHKRRSMNTVVKHKKNWLENIKKNADIIKNDVSALWINQGRFESINVSAGPSLKDDLPDLRNKIKGREIVAADAAYKFLTENGIEPDFVVCTDASAKIAAMFDGMAKTKTRLILNVIADPDFARSWPGEIYWFVMANNIFDGDGQNLIQEIHSRESRVGGKIIPGGNVSSIMLGFSLSIRNAEKVYLYGHDFCWRQDFYCGGHFKHLEEERIRSETAEKTIYQTENTKGEKVWTNLSLYQFAKWHEEATQHLRHRVENRTSCTTLDLKTRRNV